MEVADKSIDAKRAGHILTSVIERLKLRVEENERLNLNPDTVKRPACFLPKSTPQVSQGDVYSSLPLTIPPFTEDTMIRDDMFDTGGIFGTFGNEVDIPMDFNWVSCSSSLLCGTNV